MTRTRATTTSADKPRLVIIAPPDSCRWCTLQELDRNGCEGFSEWHLGVDTEAREVTKERYGFPHGDFRRVHRSGLIHAKQRAAQYGHDAVERGADQLLEMLDEESS